jgi:hypothetical protein
MSLKLIALNCFVFSMGVPYAYKRLGRPASFSISDKHDDKYFQTKSRHAIILQKIETICAKNQSRKIMMKTKSFSNGKLT